MGYILKNAINDRKSRREGYKYLSPVQSWYFERIKEYRKLLFLIRKKRC